jgi:hypothetical protein
MFKPENRTDLEQALRKHLGRNPAPEDLWNRVQEARRGPHARRAALPLGTRLAPAAAVLTIAVGGWVLWQQFSQPRSVEALAVDALGRGPEHLQFRSDRAPEIRAWLRANAGLDVPLPPRHSPLIQIVGANVIENQGRIAEISYRVGDRNAALLVQKDPSGKRSYPRHAVRPSESFDEARVSSWSMRGQSYTLAWAAPGEFRVACLLCHGDEPPMTE